MPKKISNVFLSRTILVSLLILLQIILLSSSMIFLSFKAYLFSLLLRGTSLLVVAWINSKNDNPSYKLSWIILILTAPLVGGVFYLLWGNKRLPNGLRKRMDELYRANPAHIQTKNNCSEELAAIDPQLAIQSAYITRTTAFPVCKNTANEHFPLGDIAYTRLLEELQKAERFIFLEYFIISPGLMWDSIVEILKAKKQIGLEIKIMFDDIGSINTLPKNYADTLQAMGLECTVFNPFMPHLNVSMNYRDHRKICIIDGNVAFCGGINLADEYINRKCRFGHWKDSVVMLRGEGVWNLTLMFLNLWKFANPQQTLDYPRYIPTVSAESDGYVQPFGDSPLDHYNVAQTVYLQMINRATDYVYLTTPYLVLDNETITALSSAAQSGVDVRIITPHIPDKWYVHRVSRSFYSVLIQSGVRIFEYTPGFMHAKQMVCDDKIAVVGTTNLDFRSFYLHFECGVSFYYSSVVSQVKQDILSTLSVCREMTCNALKKLPLRQRLFAVVLRIFAPLI